MQMTIEKILQNSLYYECNVPVKNDTHKNNCNASSDAIVTVWAIGIGIGTSIQSVQTFRGGRCSHENANKFNWAGSQSIIQLYNRTGTTGRKVYS